MSSMIPIFPLRIIRVARELATPGNLAASAPEQPNSRIVVVDSGQDGQTVDGSVMHVDLHGFFLPSFGER